MIKDKFPANAGVYTFSVGIGILVLGFMLTFFVNDEPFHRKHAE